MRTEQIRKLLCVLCLGLAVALGAVAMAQSQTPSILDRAQRVEDPELGDLIRLAMENRKNISKEEAFDIVRKITQSYSQIKLLDLQIEQIAQKAEATTGPAEMRYELLLAKAELESKRTTELANLRELAGIVPKLPLAVQPIQTLNTYVSLQMIGERLYILDCQKPFTDYWVVQRWKFTGWMSKKEMLDDLRKRFRDESNLPMRIHIYYDPEEHDAAMDLRSKIISVAKDTHSQMDTEVRLEEITFVGSGNSTFYLRQGKITTFYTHDAMKRPDGGSEPLASGLVNPDDLGQHIVWRLTKPKNVPLTFRIEYDQASASLARKVADTARAIIKRLGVGELANVETVRVEPVPETEFLGRWRGATRGDIHEIDVRPGGVCEVTMGDRFGKDKTPGAAKAGTTVSGTWLLTTNGIVIDINDVSPHGSEYYYRGYLEEDGSLIVDKGIIYPQGSFHVSGAPRQMILKRVQ
ncbi:MAG: hypothetical protein JSW66_13440 [Phycisphaerales bacterium]|nr:MAG: hypothetical protein JSW66_13440 [Phycisphaerales bacterium]